MGTWRRLILHDGIHGFGETDQLRDAFIDAFVAAGEPADMAVFRRHDIDRGVVILLFPPAAGAFAEHWDATPCDKPDSGHGLALLLGDDEAWPIYFPNSTRGPSTTW
ncbi:MAG TPA: hypothetical protein VLJ57_01540 [Burkholderiaceae bacterium]|nr:hypothetical protein [Burkholderiaceae bacterium]